MSETATRLLRVGHVNLIQLAAPKTRVGCIDRWLQEDIGICKGAFAEETPLRIRLIANSLGLVQQL